MGVIHKATEGLGWTDPAYAGRRAAAHANTLLWGAYHYATADDPVQQAEHFLATAGSSAGLLALDLESGGGAAMSLDQARTFVSHVQQRTGRWPGLYGGAYLRSLLGPSKDPVLANCWLWLSEYGPTPNVPPTWPTWTLWQYTDGANGPQPHTAPGIGPCDRDMFNGDEAGLQRLWGG